MAIKPGSILFDPYQNPYMILNVINKQYRLYEAKRLASNENYDIRIIRGKAIALNDQVFDCVDNRRLQQKEEKLFKMIDSINKNKNRWLSFRSTRLVINKKYNKKNIYSKYSGSGFVDKSIRNSISFNIENELLTYKDNDIITTNILFNNVLVRKDKYFCRGESDIGYYFTRFDREYFI